jgi:hypothetical protein
MLEIPSIRASARPFPARRDSTGGSAKQLNRGSGLLLTQDFSYAICPDGQSGLCYFPHQSALGACLLWHRAISRETSGDFLRLPFQRLASADKASQQSPAPPMGARIAPPPPPSRKNGRATASRTERERPEGRSLDACSRSLAQPAKSR